MKNGAGPAKNKVKLPDMSTKYKQGTVSIGNESRTDYEILQAKPLRERKSVS